MRNSEVNQILSSYHMERKILLFKNFTSHDDKFQEGTPKYFFGKKYYTRCQ